MDILVDTSIWSLVFRRNAPSELHSQKLSQMVVENRVKLIGPIRQELLSGIPNKSQFSSLKNRLQAFDDIHLNTSHFETAAEYSNKCRTNGIQGSHTDFLICAVSIIERCAIFTSDKDFTEYSKVIPLKLISTQGA